ncbi:MAG: glycosyltransferase family 1 protein [Acidimicrobiales bacterium]|nr:glycosyltransferase family 1 protein [Acidimicrobiales bacterium]
MRVAVDATSLLDTRTGVGRFTEALLTGLGQRDDVTVTAFPVSLRGRARLHDVVPDGVDVVAPPLPAAVLRQAWLRTSFPRIDTFVGHHDLIHGPNFVVPPARAARLMTVHDLTPVRFPELCNRHTLDYPRLISRAAGAGAWVHTDSDAVRDEVIAELGVDAGRVVTVPLGFQSKAGGDPEAGRALAGRDDYVLTVGTVEPRKDLPSLVRAVDQLAAAGMELPLVHVGPDGWGAEQLAQTLHEVDRPDLLHRLGFKTDRELRDLYAGARLVAYPSVYEGFGFPVLEAMSAGAPVVATRVPAVAEVAGDAAELVPVGDVETLADGLRRVWTDDERRRQLIERGRVRTEAFSWSRCIDGMVELYRRVIADAERV